MSIPTEKISENRLIYMGTPQFAAIILDGLLQDGWRPAAVVSQPDRPRGRGRKLLPSPVSAIALAEKIPLWQPHQLKGKDFIAQVQSLEPDFILTAAYGKILPTEILTLPRLGCYNIHASLLPAYRGAAPVQQAIIDGQTETGITIFRMDEGIDTGEIVATERLAIEPAETAGELTERLARLASRMLIPVMEKVALGQARFQPQSDEQASLAPILNKADGRLDWRLAAEEIHNRIRGLDPWPGVFTFLHGKRLRIWRAEVEDKETIGLPGTIHFISEKGMTVQTGKGRLLILELQLEGKKRMPVGQFIRGYQVKTGEKLDESTK